MPLVFRQCEGTCGYPKLRRPPMTSQWLKCADDQSSEFRVAAALAGLGIEARIKADAENDARSDRPGGRLESANCMPMAVHFGPVDASGFMQRRVWSKDGTPRTAVWGTESLVGNMVRVLDRRLVETQTRGLADKPLGGAAPARLEHVAAFLTEDFDDARCAALLAGLIWVRPALLRRPETQRQSAIPFAFAALKPVFTPDDMLRSVGVLEAGSLPAPPGIISRLRTGRGVDEAVRVALGRARSSGIASPFDSAQIGGRGQCGHFTLPVSARRLAAALLIPVDEWGLRKLISRAYPGTTSELHTDILEDASNAP